MADTLERICTIFDDQFGMKTDGITLQSSLADLGLDSLDVVEFVMSCEDDFDIEISEDADPKTVGDFVELIDAALAAKK